MKRFLKLFVLTPPEQRLVIVLVVLLVIGAWYKHHRELADTVRPNPAALSTPPP